MKMMIITPAQAAQIEGKHGSYSAIVPLLLPDGNYTIPAVCINDPGLISIKSELESMSGNFQYIDYLPDVGEEVYAGQIYLYPLELTGYSPYVMVIQTHIRMDYPPYETPALFTFIRPNADNLEWILNETVYVGWKRVYSGDTYEVITQHMTQADWTPIATYNVLWKLADESEIPNWVQPTGAQDDYNIGDKVKFEGAVYQSLIDANVWSPTVYPAGWQWLYDL